MGNSDITRRGLMTLGTTLLASASFRGIAFGQEDNPAKAIAQISARGDFTRATVVEIARAISKAEFTPPPSELPNPIKDLTYEQYRDIRFNRAASIWADDKLPFQLQLFHRGFYYKEAIDVAVVDNGRATHLAYSPGYWDVGKLITEPMPTDDIGFAGIRLLGHLNSQEKFDEVAVFQGASYFRSVGRDQVYGLSSRGLALKTADAEGEEFPLFRGFWVEKPMSDSDSVVVHALLDSASVSGAYRFTIRPGDQTEMDVEAVLFPRVDLSKVGLAPGTSMFYFDLNGREKIDDYRPEVHDSDGLLMISGRGERIWRPLANPAQLQISSFLDTAPRGFGLMQRNRDAEAYQDFEASYERRPSLWVEPVGDWGDGAVVLVEIPSASEINDNIVAYWQPKQPIAAGSEYALAYRLSWGEEPTPGPGVAAVRATMRGRASLQGDSPVRRFIIDYALPEPELPTAPLPQAKVTASAGEITEVTIQHNPLIGGWRLTFKLDPKDSETIELRADVEPEAAPAAETWLYRWTV